MRKAKLISFIDNVICFLGYFCNNTFGPVDNYNLFECPRGYYCPSNTKYATQHPCPPGTHQNLTKRVSPSDCLPCPAKFACDALGIIYPTKLCSAGYFCKYGSNSTTPSLGSNANECPPGRYCREGTFLWLLKMFYENSLYKVVIVANLLFYNTVIIIVMTKH